MDEQCTDCGHFFDIHHLKNGMCSQCFDIEEAMETEFEERRCDLCGDYYGMCNHDNHE